MRKQITFSEVQVGDYAVGNGREFRVEATLTRNFETRLYVIERSPDGTFKSRVPVSALRNLGFTFEREVHVPTGVGAVVRAGKEVYVRIPRAGSEYVWCEQDNFIPCWFSDEEIANFDAFEILSVGVEV